MLTLEKRKDHSSVIQITSSKDFEKKNKINPKQAKGMK